MWARIEKLRIHILGVTLFLSMMDSLFFVEIGDFKLKAYQVLGGLFLIPLKYLRKSGVLFLLIFNFFLLFSSYQGYLLGVPLKPIWVNIIKLEIFGLFVFNFVSLTTLFESRRILFEYIFWGALLSSMYGLVQFASFNLFGYVLPGNPESKILGEHLLKRVYSFFPEPNWYSMQMMLAVPVCYLIVKKKPERMLGFVIILLALLLSMSRGAWLCMIIFFYFLYLEQRGAMKAVTTILAPAAAFVFLVGVGIFFRENEFFYRLTHLDFANDPSFSSRLDGILAMGNYYSFVVGEGHWQNLLLGCGMLSFQTLFWPFEVTHATSFFAMNFYLDLFIEHGLIATLMLLFLCIKYIRKILRFKGYSSLSRRMFALVFISCMLMSAFYPLKSYFANLPILAFYIALLMQVPFGAKAQEEDFA